MNSARVPGSRTKQAPVIDRSHILRPFYQDTAAIMNDFGDQHTVSFCIYTKNANDKWNFVSNLGQFVDHLLR